MTAGFFPPYLTLVPINGTIPDTENPWFFPHCQFKPVFILGDCWRWIFDIPKPEATKTRDGVNFDCLFFLGGKMLSLSFSHGNLYAAVLDYLAWALTWHYCTAISHDSKFLPDRKISPRQFLKSPAHKSIARDRIALSEMCQNFHLSLSLLPYFLPQERRDMGNRKWCQRALSFSSWADYDRLRVCVCVCVSVRCIDAR